MFLVSRANMFLTLHNLHPEYALVWLTLSTGSLAVAALPCLSSVAQHGKVWQRKRYSKNAEQRTISEMFLEWRVSKNMFISFYILGSILSVAALVGGYSCTTFYRYPLTLYLVHVMRRWWESVCMTEYGKSSMHVSGLVVGFLHYLFVPLTLVGCRKDEFSGSTNAIVWQIIVSSLFAMANVQQFLCHRMLYQLKKDNVLKLKRYSLPTEGLFRLVCCPHYFAEILIYLSIWMLCPSSMSLLALLFWVSSNLMVVSHNQMTWYRSNFPEVLATGDKLKTWKRIFPYVW